jgi:hypothetical protein
MQNLYLAFQYQPVFENFPEKEKLLEYKNTIQCIRDQLKPDRDLQKIDEEIVNVFLKDIRTVLNGLDNMINNYSLDTIINGLNTIYKLLKNAITQLIVALDTLKEINQGGFDRKLKTQYYECLDECKEFLDDILENF